MNKLEAYEDFSDRFGIVGDKGFQDLASVYGYDIIRTHNNSSNLKCPKVTNLLSTFRNTH